MKRTAVIFQAPLSVRTIRETVPEPAGGELGVRIHHSAISAGSELLFYRGEAPAGMALDETLPALQGPAGFPLRYGYAAVGEVAAAGPEADPSWVGRRVFCFHPHASYGVMRPADAIPLPEDIESRDALFLANAETAVTLVLDGRPAIGERVVVFGQGTVGLLTAALLARMPLAGLFTVEPLARRRQASRESGVDGAYAPGELEPLRARLQADSDDAMADLIYELSGAPQCLDDAIAIAGMGSRIVVGSWYGNKAVRINLGGRFHRDRIRLISSQVSSLPPDLLARWSKNRRLEVAWDMLRRIRPSRWITHELEAGRAAEAYALIDQNPGEVLQVVLTYGGG
jgi:2-desacetyl-2-hydroxyethyl bacteriochlorophyllide A dehydrogenase